MTSMIRSDAIYCEKIARRHARTFSLATYFLPARKRRAATAVFAFCRTTEDIATSSESDRKLAVRRLQGHRREFLEALAGRPRGPVFREVRWTIREFSIPGAVLLQLIDAMIANPGSRQFEIWDDLIRHCDTMAGPVGSMYGAVFGIPGGPRHRELALAHARTFGVALQLTSILRDVGQDARAGRCWLPTEELVRFGLCRDEVLDNTEIAQDPRWHRLMTFEIARARALYENALPGITMLSPDSQRCAAGCAIGYAAFLDALEEIRYDSLSIRASVSTLARLGVLWDAWRFKSRAG